jgi:hypothetical protein
MSFLGDIIKEPTPEGRRYSQGRIYLFISFIAFIVINAVLAYCAFKGIPLEDKESLELVSSNLKWALGSFSLYTLGTKGVGAFRDGSVGISNNYDKEGAYNPYGGHNGGYNQHNHKSNNKSNNTNFKEDENEIN